MKHSWTKMAAFCLSGVMLIGSASAAAMTTDDGHVLRKPELMEGFEFPENWSEEALRFAVSNEIMQGDGETLAETSNATRAEMATMLVQLLKLEEEADLSAYTDADPEQWYYNHMAKAVAAGVVSGTSDSTLSPNAKITREQVVTMLRRAFALNPADPDKWESFADSWKISNFARPAVSALAERGFLTGSTDGRVYPQKNITRAEIAQIFYAIFTAICDAPEELPASGRVLYRGKDALPENYAVDGDLTLCSVGMTGGSVTGTLTLRGKSVTLTDCEVPSVSLAVGTSLSGNVTPEKLSVSGQNSVVDVSAGTVLVYGDATLNGDYDKVVCMDGSMSVAINGHVGTVEIPESYVTLSGSGSADLIDIGGAEVTVGIEAKEIHDAVENARKEAATIETMVVWDTVIRDTALYANSNLSGYLRELPAGTKLEQYYLHDGAKAASVYTTDGVFGYVPVDAIEIPEKADVREEPYSDMAMEIFVNSEGCSSSTNFLIWVNLKTQTTNIFTGSKGQWVLERSFPCCTGKNSTPTVRGNFTIRYKDPEWNFGDYKVNNVSGFYEGYAFHSITYEPDYSAVIDGTIGYPASHGCVRMNPDGCGYIYENIPMGTRVFVY